MFSHGHIQKVLPSLLPLHISLLLLRLILYTSSDLCACTYQNNASLREAAPTCSDSLCDNSSCVLDDSKIGSADMDIIEMEIYDKYRKLDGHEYPHMYLKKCRNKLIAKVKQCRENIHNLEIELAQTKWKSALEKKELGSFMT